MTPAFHRRRGPYRPFSGKPEDIASDIPTSATIGADELIFDFCRRFIAGSIRRPQWFALEVMPLATG